jgi:hypothetical protein
MTVRVQLSEAHEIEVPAAVMDKLQIKGGDHLLLEVRNGYAVLIPEPGDYSRRLRGLHAEIWEGIEPQEYVRGEREAWKG